MKTLWKSFKITIAFCIFFSLFYILVLWIFAQFAGPNKGNAEVATLNGKVVGAANVGQMFTQDIYFWGRPSAGNYTADASGGSNKGPTNDEYLAEVEARIDTFLVHHPCAYVQVKRVAQARGMNEAEVKAIVDKNISKPFLGVFGTETVNVLELNIALEEADQNK